jgi:hypothetical protein
MQDRFLETTWNRIDQRQPARFEALEDARVALRQRSTALGLQDELATVIRMFHGTLGLDEGGVL